VQLAAPALFRDGKQVRSQILARVAANLATLRRIAMDYPAARVLTCEGGWSAVIQVPAIQSEERLVLQLLTEDHVLVHPGYFFDFQREAFVVVSLLVTPAMFEQGVTRLLARATSPSSHL
jgi:aspartate/methionine/tyrosine aminotransferase